MQSTSILLYLFFSISITVATSFPSSVVFVDGDRGKDDVSCGAEENPCKTIQYGIDQNSDMVVIAPMQYSGIGNTNITVSKKDIILTSLDINTMTQVVIDCENVASISGLKIMNRLTVHISGFHFKNCMKNGLVVDSALNVSLTNVEFSNCKSSAYGGAIYVKNTELVSIQNSTFRNNTSENGGAIAAGGGMVHIRSTEFSENFADNAGGAIYGREVNITLSDVSFKNNSALSYGKTLFTVGSTLRVVANCTIIKQEEMCSDIEEECGGTCLYEGQCTVVGCERDVAALHSMILFSIIAASVVFVVIVVGIFAKIVDNIRKKHRRANYYVIPDFPSPRRPQPCPRPEQLVTGQENNAATETTCLNDSCKSLGETIASKDLCKICCEHQINNILFPCKHAAACSVCAPRLKTCPFCREPIMSILQFFPC